MKHTIRGSDVWIKEDLAGFLMALQMAAAKYPQGEFHDGFLAAITSMRAMLNISVSLADIDAAMDLQDMVRVLPTERRMLR